MKSYEWRGSLTFMRSRHPKWNGLMVSPSLHAPLPTDNEGGGPFIFYGFFFIGTHRESWNAIILKDRYEYLTDLRRKSQTPYCVGRVSSYVIQRNRRTRDCIRLIHWSATIVIADVVYDIGWIDGWMWGRTDARDRFGRVTSSLPLCVLMHNHIVVLDTDYVRLFG